MAAKRSSATSRSIKCNSCDRALAIISSSGELVSAGAQDQACDKCSKFEELYNNIQAKDEAFCALEHRRSDHGGRQQALYDAKAAHIAFDNFLIRVEAIPEPLDTTPQKHSPEPAQSQEYTEGKLAPSTGQKRGFDSTPPATPRAAKRARVSDSEPARRVTFDPTTTFREGSECRREMKFNRMSNEYVPGPNAPPEGTEYLNTSGLGLTPTKFHGVKKQGKKWVETKEGKEDDQQWSKEPEQGTSDYEEDHGDTPDERQEDVEEGDTHDENGNDVKLVSIGGRGSKERISVLEDSEGKDDECASRGFTRSTANDGETRLELRRRHEGEATAQSAQTL